VTVLQAGKPAALSFSNNAPSWEVLSDMVKVSRRFQGSHRISSSWLASNLRFRCWKSSKLAGAQQGLVKVSRSWFRAIASAVKGLQDNTLCKV
jgi:hypothetical protein